MSILLNQQSKEIILNSLKIKLLSDIDDMEYPDRKWEFNRNEIEEESHHSRGSVRITDGCYFTEQEYKEYRKEIRSIKL